MQRGHQVPPHRATEAAVAELDHILFDSNPEVMWVYDTESLAFLLVNDAAVQNYGYSREEFLSMTLRDIRPPEDGPGLENALENGLEADLRNPGELHAEGPWRHKKKDGSIVHVDG